MAKTRRELLTFQALKAMGESVESPPQKKKKGKADLKKPHLCRILGTAHSPEESFPAGVKTYHC